jgi:hypothetical protein
MLSPRTMSIISSAVVWAERILQHIDGVFQPTIGTLLIRSNQELMHLRTISRLLERQSNSPPTPISASAFRPRFTPGFDLRNPRARPILVGIQLLLNTSNGAEVSYSPRDLANENSHSFLTLLIVPANRADWLPPHLRSQGTQSANT